jgi:hypothetical protein
VLVALVLVLLAQLDDLLEDLHIEALALGLGEDFLLSLIQLLDFVLDLLDALHERADSIARDSNDVTHGFSFAIRRPALSGSGVSAPLIGSATQDVTKRECRIGRAHRTSMKRRQFLCVTLG